MEHQSVAVIADIVKSREMTDRVGAYHDILFSFQLAGLVVPPEQLVWPTVGDEFQAVYTSMAEAVLATTLVRLSLPTKVDLRFGLGRGIRTVLLPKSTDKIQDGTAWYSARAAITEANRRQKSGSRHVRTWFVSDQQLEPATSPQDAVVNAYLLLRDSTISSMKPRAQRLALGTILGKTQQELARAEGISQSAVSQSLSSSGASSLIAGNDLLLGGLKP